jgi:hypothetical protein
VVFRITDKININLRIVGHERAPFSLFCATIMLDGRCPLRGCQDRFARPTQTVP